MNKLKQALAAHRPQIGLWQALANAYTAEICAGAGYDWLLFDGEHAPNTIQTLLAQLQAVKAYPVEAVARPPVGDPVVIKQYLDIGFRSLIIPMVESVQQAQMLVSATRYPPHGNRGVASAISRAAGFGANAKYLENTHENICLILQIESAAGLKAIDDIAALDGVDGLFIGPSDLGASLGHLGNAGHPDVQNEISSALARIRKAGKTAGIFATSAEAAKRYAEAGACMISVGTDLNLLLDGVSKLRKSVSL
jgi:4-hydroxy-2-oxoheptanedioate aldolase